MNVRYLTLIAMRLALPLLTLVYPHAAIAQEAEKEESPIVDPIRALTTKTSAEYLLKLDEEEMPRLMNQLLYELYRASKQGYEAREAMDISLTRNGCSLARKQFTTKRIVFYWQYVNKLRLFTQENLERAKNGQNMIYTSPKGKQEVIVTNYVLPPDEYPEFKHEIANLELIPHQALEQRGGELSKSAAALEASLKEFKPLGEVARALKQRKRAQRPVVPRKPLAKNAATSQETPQKKLKPIAIELNRAHKLNKYGWPSNDGLVIISVDIGKIVYCYRYYPWLRYREQKNRYALISYTNDYREVTRRENPIKLPGLRDDAYPLATLGDNRLYFLSKLAGPNQCYIVIDPGP